MAQRTVLLDTSLVIALENKDDPHHARALALDDELLKGNATLLFHWGILTEIADGYARLSRRVRGIHLLEMLTSQTGYALASIDPPFLHEAIGLYSNRLDKDWGLTDCLSFVLMKRHDVTEALTADIHFRQAGFVALLLETS